MTGVPITSIYDKIKKLKLQSRQRNESRKTNPPFGYAWLSGQLVVNPIEFKTVQLIQHLHSTGMRPYQIEKHLNNLKTPTRKGGKWFARIICNILASAGKITSVS